MRLILIVSESCGRCSRNDSSELIIGSHPKSNEKTNTRCGFHQRQTSWWWWGNYGKVGDIQKKLLPYSTCSWILPPEHHLNVLIQWMSPQCLLRARYTLDMMGNTLKCLFIALKEILVSSLRKEKKTDTSTKVKLNHKDQNQRQQSSLNQKAEWDLVPGNR